MKTHILITGASGFLGRNLVTKLKNKYYLTLLVHRRVPAEFKGDDIRIVKGSISDVNFLLDQVDKVDVIIHLAGITHSNKKSIYKKINTDGTKNLIEIARQMRVKQFIYISTRAVGVNCGPYGESKLKAENAIIKSGLNFTILRVGEAYNDNFNTKEGLGSLSRLVSRLPVVPCISDRSVTLAPIHADDVGSCITASVENSKTYLKTYTVAGPENLTLMEVAKRIAKFKKLRRTFLPLPVVILLMVQMPAQLFGVLVGDQIARLTCRKKPLSKNVFEDLGVKPREFIPEAKRNHSE